MKKMNLSLTALSLSLGLMISCKDVPRYENPTQLITVDAAKDLNTRFISERSNIISQSINKDDANAVWFSIEELENYINYVKCEGDKQNIDINGIRFYMGVYPNDPTNYQEKAGLSTIFLSPTKKKASVNIKSVSKTSARQLPTTEENTDVTTIQPLNYGGIGHPPKIEYPVEE
jgi:hypothetical protein